MNSLTGVLILAGGKSERMNFPKAYLLFKEETFLKRIVEEYYDAGIKNIFVVLNEDFCIEKWKEFIDQIKLKATIIRNPDPELGRFHSLKLGAKKMQDLEFCFIQNVDNPFVNKEIINSLITARNSTGYASPQFMGRNGHPVLISKKIIRHLNELPEGNFNLKNILSDFSRHVVQVNNNDILLNINTKEEYERCIEKRSLLNIKTTQEEKEEAIK